jgi:hypothetical protein
MAITETDRLLSKQIQTIFKQQAWKEGDDFLPKDLGITNKKLGLVLCVLDNMQCVDKLAGKGQRRVIGQIPTRGNVDECVGCGFVKSCVLFAATGEDAEDLEDFF